MATLALVLLILAFLCFVLATFTKFAKFDIIALGLAFFTASLLVGAKLP